MITKIILVVIALIVVGGSVVIFGGSKEPTPSEVKSNKEAAGNSEFRSGNVGKSNGKAW
jgi:hypothetical protein